MRFIHSQPVKKKFFGLSHRGSPIEKLANVVCGGDIDVGGDDVVVSSGDVVVVGRDVVVGGSVM